MKKILFLITASSLFFFSPIAMAQYRSPLGAFSDGVSQGLQNIYNIQQMRVLEEQRRAMEQQRLLMEQEHRGRLEEQRAQVEQKNFMSAIKEVHPDIERYLADGSLLSWINSKPAHIRASMMEIYDHGDINSSILLITHFKKDSGLE